MTVTASEARVEYAGNGSVLVFAYPYQFYEGDDLEVWLTDDVSGVGVLQVYGTNYTVTGVMNPTGGNVSFAVAPPSGKTVIIINAPDITQLTHYVNADDFPADSHEAALDKLTKICQRLEDQHLRSVRAPDYTPVEDVPDADYLEELVDRAETAATNSENSANAASGSANNAQAAQTAAQASATAAAASATSASGSATTATNAASAASTSATNAATSATNASNSAAAAAASASAAQVAKMTWRGNWSSATAYVASDVVFESGSSWIAKGPNTNVVPSVSPATWDLVAQKGAKGDPGSGGGGGSNIASDIVFTPGGNLSQINVQSALLEVDNEKVAKAGDTMTGHLSLPTGPAAANAVRKDYVDGLITTVTTAYQAADTALQTNINAKADTATVNSDNAAQNTVINAKADKTYVDSQNSTQDSAIALKAPLASPVFTGNPQGPTPSPGDNDTSLATTAFVTAAIAAMSTAAPLSQRVDKFINEDYVNGSNTGAFILAVMKDGSCRVAGPSQSDNRDYSAPLVGLTDLRRFNIPAGILGTPVKIFGTPHSTFILTDQGDVCCCGANASGDLGVGNTTASNNMQLLPSTSIGPRSAGGSSRAIVEIACAHWADTNVTTQYTTYFRCADGTLWAAGYNSTGACAQGNTTSPQSTLVQCKKTGNVAIADAAKVFCGAYSTNGCSGAYIDTSGKVSLCGALNSGAWGRNTSTGSQTLFNQPMTNTDIGTSDLPPTYQAIEVIIAQGNTTYIRCADKCVYSCGVGTSGNIGNGAASSVNVLKKAGSGTAVAGTLNGTIERMFNVHYRNDGANHLIIVQLTDGSCYAWGANQNNAMPVTPTGSVSTPAPCLAPFTAGCPNISKIICGNSASTNPVAKIVAILANNAIYSWGNSRFDGSGGAWTASSTPVLVSLPVRAGSPTVLKVAGVGYYIGVIGYGTCLAVLYSDWTVIGLDIWALGPVGVTWNELMWLQR